MSNKLGLGMTLFTRNYEFKVRQMLMTGADEPLVFGIFEEDGKLVSPYEETMTINQNFREYHLKFKLHLRDVTGLLLFSTVAGWAPATHMLVSVKAE